MTTTLTSFEAKDFLEIKARDYDIRTNSVYDNQKRLLSVFENLGHTYTFRVGDEIACIVGIIKIWKDVFECYMITSDTAYKDRFLARKLKVFLDQHMKDLSIKRLQCTVSENYPIAKRFVEFFGFTPEGVLRQYINGEDYIMYSIIRK